MSICYYWVDCYLSWPKGAFKKVWIGLILISGDCQLYWCLQMPNGKHCWEYNCPRISKQLLQSAGPMCSWEGELDLLAAPSLLEGIWELEKESALLQKHSAFAFLPQNWDRPFAAISYSWLLALSSSATVTISWMTLGVRLSSHLFWKNQLQCSCFSSAA